MISPIREQYNANFTKEKYKAFLQTINKEFNHTPPFRISETPIFVDKKMKQKLFEACEEITNVICKSDFKKRSQGAMLPGQIVPNEDDHTLFLQMDFGICLDEKGELTPQLIEIQGFPSLYFFQDLLANAYQEHFDIPSNYSHLFNGLDSEKYMKMLQKVIVGSSKPENIVLVDVEPENQATRIDFYGAEHHLGIQTKCVSQLKKEGKDVYYTNAKGRKVGVEKILNRVIFDELFRKENLKRDFYFTQDAEVKWLGHPNWFFRISKYTLPLLESKYNPKSYFLNEIDRIPEDLENYVLKPLYSFAGTGVILNLNRYDLESIKDPENYILQRKVAYAPVIQTPNVPAKCEIRMLMIWEEGAARPTIVNNLARISKGEMIGVRYNKDKDWVGASVGLFEQ